MSELINNSDNKKSLLKHMILQLHEGVAPELVRSKLVKLLSSIPYDDVVEVEQELINEGLPESEVLKLCDLHSYALDGMIDTSAMPDVPAGHPVDTFMLENRELEKIKSQIDKMCSSHNKIKTRDEIDTFCIGLRGMFNMLMDVDKHYRRKENLLFPYLEKHEITGPPKVMWGKHDEIREQLKASIEALSASKELNAEDISSIVEMLLLPAAKAVTDMIMKEEEILFPMCMDKLTIEEWYEVYKQTNEIGYCLYDPKDEWKPEGVDDVSDEPFLGGKINLHSGSFTATELKAILNTLPIDITFVDKDDKVAYFSQGNERIFDRNRAILQRDVRLCHPPNSVGIVDQIIDDFKSGKESSAPFWIQMGGKFIHIEYFALRDDEGNYLGTLEMSQDLTGKRALDGEQRLLSYSK